MTTKKGSTVVYTVLDQGAPLMDEGVPVWNLGRLTTDIASNIDPTDDVTVHIYDWDGEKWQLEQEELTFPARFLWTPTSLSQHGALPMSELSRVQALAKIVGYLDKSVAVAESQDPSAKVVFGKLTRLFPVMECTADDSTVVRLSSDLQLLARVDSPTVEHTRTLQSLIKSRFATVPLQIIGASSSVEATVVRQKGRGMYGCQSPQNPVSSSRFRHQTLEDLSRWEEEHLPAAKNDTGFPADAFNLQEEAVLFNPNKWSAYTVLDVWRGLLEYFEHQITEAPGPKNMGAVTQLRHRLRTTTQRHMVSYEALGDERAMTQELQELVILLAAATHKKGWAGARKAQRIINGTDTAIPRWFRAWQVEQTKGSQDETDTRRPQGARFRTQQYTPRPVYQQQQQKLVCRWCKTSLPQGTSFRSHNASCTARPPTA